jgi:hypothetical protein
LMGKDVQKHILTKLTDLRCYRFNTICITHLSDVSMHIGTAYKEAFM